MIKYTPRYVVKARKTKAFTLAEVLITLLIIGVVASLVIPALINETNKAEYVAKLKKESAILQQAFKLVVLEVGGSILNNPNFNCSGSSCDTTASAGAMNDFATKLSVIKNCGSGMGCWYNSSIKYLGSGEMTANLDSSLGFNRYCGKAILADGTMVKVEIYNTNCTTNPGSTPANSPFYNSVCGNISIDINGSKGPNQMGRDYFNFWITRKGLYPFGIYNDGRTCDVNSTTYTTCQGCTAKVLTEGAMNY